EGNEIADTLAKEGSRNTQRPSQHAYLSFSNIKRQARADAFEGWINDWDKRKSGKRYRGEPKRKLEPLLKDLPKLEAARIVQLRTGHGYFHEYLARLSTSEIESARCSWKLATNA